MEASADECRLRKEHRLFPVDSGDRRCSSSRAYTVGWEDYRLLLIQGLPYNYL